MSRRLWLILLPLAVSFVIVAGIYIWLKPKAREFVKTQIVQVVNERTPLELSLGDFNWSFFWWPRVYLEDVRLSGKPGEEQIPTVTIKQASASLDLLSLFAGQISLAHIEIEDPSVQLDLDPLMTSTGPAKPLPLDGLFQLLDQIPISRLTVKNLSADLVSKKKLEMDIQVRHADIQMASGKNRLKVLLLAPDSTVIHNNVRFPAIVETELQLTPQQLDIVGLKLNAFNSILTANGVVTNASRIHLNPQGKATFTLHSDLSRVQTALSGFGKMPELSGLVQSSGSLQIDRAQTISGDISLVTKQIKIDHFDVGDLQTSATLTKNKIHAEKFQITNEAGFIDLSDVVFDLGHFSSEAPATVKARIHSDMIDLNELLIRLGVGDIPLEAFLNADLNCEGPVYPGTKIQCSGQAGGEQFEVRSGDSLKNKIAGLEKFGVDGSVTITDHAISYDANLEIGQTKGKSTGEIGYKTGFSINYNSPSLYLSDLSYLAGLKLEGSGQISGSTKGDSDSAVFDIKLKGKDLHFEDFYLGDAEGLISYKRGHLFFSDLKGRLNNSEYFAELDVNLLKSTLEADGQMPALEVNDLLLAFNRLFKMPVSISGNGFTQVHAEGPFDLSKLSYSVIAGLNKGQVAGEYYDRIDLQLQSKDGEVRLTDSQVIKEQTKAIISGEAHPNGQINVAIEAKDFPIENSQNLTRFSQNLFGTMDIMARVNGHVRDPQVQVITDIKTLNIDEQSFPPSTLGFKINRSSLEGTASLLGSRLIADFKIPLNETGEFDLGILAQNWNYTTLFAFLGSGSILKEYSANLTGNLKLHSDSGIRHATGSGTIDRLALGRGSLHLENPLPMELNMKNGEITLENFELKGDNSVVALRGQNFTLDQMGVDVDARFDMRLLQVFLPFLEDLGGTLKAQMNVSGKILEPQVSGQASIANGYVRAKGFPHAFEQVQASAQFSQQQLIIKELKGNLGGGYFQADGSLRFNGFGDVPLDLRARIYQSTFNIPDGFRTTGDAEVSISGDWFPYLLSGSYRVTQGHISKEFQDTSGATVLQQSAYLPKFARESSFEPVTLDLDVILERNVQIRNSLMDGPISGAVTVRGTPTSPVILGKITADKSAKLLIRERIFDVNTLNVEFNNPSELNPILYISAQTRLEEYDISMLVQGPAKDPQIRFSSVPPLPDQDIISLLALGMTSATIDRRIEASKSSEDQTGKAAAGTLAATALSSFTQKNLGFAVEYSSQYDDTKNVNVQKITISKKLSEKVKASASQLQGSRSGYEAKIQYQFNPNFSAIGSWESGDVDRNTLVTDDVKPTESILGVDLDYKKEFR